MPVWPKQSECDAFYGNPRNPRDVARVNPQWEEDNIIRIRSPYPLTYDGRAVSVVSTHKKCAEALKAALNSAWEKVGRDIAKAQALHMTAYGGGFVYRLMRTGSALSMHSYGCAWDFDPQNNRLGQRSHFFKEDHPLVAAFLEQGAVWGGHWPYPDAMHVQFARVR